MKWPLKEEKRIHIFILKIKLVRSCVRLYGTPSLLQRPARDKTCNNVRFKRRGRGRGEGTRVGL